MKTATARKNGSYGFKAVVVYDDQRTKTPVQKNFATRDLAIAYAQAWIDANDSRPVGVRHPKWTWTPAVTSNARLGE